MKFLLRERAALDRLLPGLDEELRALPFELLESKDNPGIEAFRRAGGAGLVIPASLEGAGASRLDAVRVMRALAARAPSTAVGSMMHVVSTASFCPAAERDPAAAAFVGAIATNRWLVASGHAEGRTGAAFHRPRYIGRPVDGGYRLSGTKKPCSLARSMDLITVLFAVPSGSEQGGDREHNHRRAHAVLGARSEGITVEPFWRSPVLAGAQSEAVVFDDVFIPTELITVPENEAAFSADETEGLLWFSLLAPAAYLGCCSALVERCIFGRRGSAEQRALMAADLDASMLALESIARRRDEDQRAEVLLQEAIAVRLAVERVLARAAPEAVQCLGGQAFIESCEVSYLFAATQALAFHPPQRAPAVQALAAAYEGSNVSFF